MKDLEYNLEDVKASIIKYDSSSSMGSICSRLSRSNRQRTKLMKQKQKKSQELPPECQKRLSELMKALGRFNKAKKVTSTIDSDRLNELLSVETSVENLSKNLNHLYLLVGKSGRTSMEELLVMHNSRKGLDVIAEKLWNEI